MSTTRAPRFVAKFLVGAAITATAIVLACGGDATGPKPPPKPAAGIKVVAGANASDTVNATMTQALTVEVRDSAGQLVPGTVVRFTGVPVKDVSGMTHPSALVEALDANQFTNFAGPTTDAGGRAGVFVQLGIVAGTARVALAVPTYGYVDTVDFTVQPGAARTLSFQPSDTAVVVGGAAKLRVAVVDRLGNPRNDPVTYDPSSAPAVATVASDGTLTGVSVGSVTITAHAGTVTKTGTAEVVPKAVIAAYYGGGSYSDSTGIVTLNLDGTNRRWIVRVGGSSNGPTAPVWTASGDIIYTGPESTNSYTSRLFIVTPGGTAKLLNASGTPNATVEAWPQFNAATSKTFYTGMTTAYQWQLFSRASDGTITEITPEGTSNYSWRASPSPDGTKLAYVTAVNYSAAIKVFDITSGTTSSWNVPGQLPVWSPKGDQIAYIPSGGGRVSVMNADGSNPHPISSSWYYEEVYTWSPDGAWIIAKSASGSIDLISTTTGTTVPLKYLSAYYYPAWK